MRHKVKCDNSCALSDKIKHYGHCLPLSDLLGQSITEEHRLSLQQKLSQTQGRSQEFQKGVSNNRMNIKLGLTAPDAEKS